MSVSAPGISFTISSSAGTYDVLNCTSLSAAIGATVVPGAFCLVDSRILELYDAEVRTALAGCRILAVHASEATKSYASLEPLFLALLEQGLKRDGTLLVIGGGVLQDIGCFIASVLFRGIPWSLVPTTLLAQADSCIGSKSSINLGPYKNQIGTFYPPRAVALTSDVLGTLAWDDMRSGIGEMLKLHLLTSEAEYQHLLTALAGLPRDTAALPASIQRSLRIKQRYIEEDEFDTGVRNLLNYGHTFAHAYESVTHYAIPHGIAVTLGVLTATFVSASLGLVTEGYFAILARELRAWYTPFERTLRDVDPAMLRRALLTDKKATAQGINCILTRGAGAMEKQLVPLDEVLLPAIGDLLERLGQDAPAR